MANHSATKGKVVLVPFPFDDLSGTKVRPAVCLTNPLGPYRHVVLAFITSQIPADLLEADIVLRSNDAEFSATGLRMSSTLRLHRLMTVTTSLIRRELGVLSPSITLEVDNRLRKLFELT
jgi:mRNA interferase MazF